MLDEIKKVIAELEKRSKDHFAKAVEALDDDSPINDYRSHTDRANAYANSAELITQAIEKYSEKK